MTPADRAFDFVNDGAVVGLGTGHAASEFVRALGARVRDGFKVRGVPTSERTADLARREGIELTTLHEVDAVDVTVDGADEVDRDLNLIKGYGGALAREKIVAACSRRVVILADVEKLVPVLGSRGRLPIEVVPFGASAVARRLREGGFHAALRTINGSPFVTDNGNMILDCTLSSIEDPESVEMCIRAIPGVVVTGLFLGVADIVIVGNGRCTTTLERPKDL